MTNFDINVAFIVVLHVLTTVERDLPRCLIKDGALVKWSFGLTVYTWFRFNRECYERWPYVSYS